MEVKACVDMEVTADKLAESLAAATPQEFAQFWFEFAKITEKRDLRPFASAMAADLGGMRKQPLHRLCELMSYFETKNRIENEEAV